MSWLPHPRHSIALSLILVITMTACGGRDRHPESLATDPSVVEQPFNSSAPNSFQEANREGSSVLEGWPSPDRAPSLAGQGWRTESFDILTLEDGAEGEWFLKKGTETVLLRVFVYREGHDAARRRLRQITSATTMPESPFEQTPIPIGAISVYVPGDTVGHYVWVYSNYCFEVRGFDTDSDIEALARWMQSIAERRARGVE